MKHADHVYHSAAAAWIEVLASFGAPEAIGRAVSEEIIVERWGFGPDAGRIVEVIEGATSVARWAALTNPITEFELGGAVSVDRADEPAHGVARYVVRVPHFEGGGTFRFSLADDGRIAHLAHRPDDLDDPLIERDDHESWRQILGHANRRTKGLAPHVDTDSAGAQCHVHHDLHEVDEASDGARDEERAGS